MNNEQLLRAVQAKITSGEMKREEVEQMLRNIPQIGKKGWNFSITRMLYFIGAAIVIVGIIIFVAQIWKDIGSIGRITVTFGLGMLFALLGSILMKQKPNESIGSVFHTIGGVLIPGGSMVILSELNRGYASIWPVTLTIGVIFLFYILLTTIHKRAILTFFAIANGTSFIYLLVESLLQQGTYRIDDIYVYVTMVVGICYLLLSHSFRNTWNKDLINILNFFGSTAVLGAAITQVDLHVSWQLFYFVLVGMGLLVSIYLQSRIILIMSTLFLIGHISFITGKYFANSIGWPLALVLLGLIFIALGYSSFKIGKKYIKT